MIPPMPRRRRTTFSSGPRPPITSAAKVVLAAAAGCDRSDAAHLNPPRSWNSSIRASISCTPKRSISIAHAPTWFVFASTYLFYRAQSSGLDTAGIDGGTLPHRLTRPLMDFSGAHGTFGHFARQNRNVFISAGLCLLIGPVLLSRHRLQEPGRQRIPVADHGGLAADLSSANGLCALRRHSNLGDLRFLAQSLLPFLFAPIAKLESS